MSKKFAQLAETYRDNMSSGMYRVLAGQLGVSEDAVRAFGIGFAPAMTFKSGTYWHGWWTIPQRDETGTITGIALRGMKGRKSAVDGSKLGLFYSCDENARPDERRDWVRIGDVGVTCPICEKPDGCLVSDDDIDDPSDVICCRVREGSVRPFQIGFLHRRKGSVYAPTSLLPKSDRPVLIVEGYTDAMAALTMGFVAVGRPGALAGLSMLATLTRGRDAIVVGENDQPDRFGRKAGTAGVEAVAGLVGPTCRSLVTVYPPDDIKDLRAWVHAGVTDDEFLRYANDAGTTPDTESVLASDAPLYVAETWLNVAHMKDGLPLIRRHRGQWFRWSGSHYEEIDPDAVIRGGLHEYLKGRSYDDGKGGAKPFKPGRSAISDIMDALNTKCPIDADPPCWLDGRDGPGPKALVPFRNGALDADAYVDGGDALIEPTPAFFSTTCLPYDFDPDAECPLWGQWLDDTLGDDPAKIALLQEWFGYCMVADMSMEKLLIMQGKPRSGKGTALEVLRALVGHRQVATTTFGSLCSDFGRAPLVGKLVAFMPDARIPKRADSMQALETLLSIVGQDGVNVNRKNLPELPDHRLTCRFTIAVNELPELPDHSQALEPRLNMLHFARSFKGKENRELKVSLPREAPGISLWALDGLRRLRERRMFTMPESSARLVEEFRRTTSPVVEFVEHCCTLGDPDVAIIAKMELYDAWAKWAYEKGLTSGRAGRFSSRLTSSFPHVASETAFVGERKAAAYSGITLQDWAWRELLGKTT